MTFLGIDKAQTFTYKPAYIGPYGYQARRGVPVVTSHGLVDELLAGVEVALQHQLVV